jgi:hypothetical protein
MGSHDADIFSVAGNSARPAAHTAYLRLVDAEQIAELLIGRIGELDEEIQLICEYHYYHPY